MKQNQYSLEEAAEVLKDAERSALDALGIALWDIEELGIYDLDTVVSKLYVGRAGLLDKEPQPVTLDRAGKALSMTLARQLIDKGWTPPKKDM